MRVQGIVLCLPTIMRERERLQVGEQRKGLGYGPSQALARGKAALQIQLLESLVEGPPGPARDGASQAQRPQPQSRHRAVEALSVVRQGCEVRLNAGVCVAGCCTSALHPSPAAVCWGRQLDLGRAVGGLAPAPALYPPGSLHGHQAIILLLLQQAHILHPHIPCSDTAGAEEEEEGEETYGDMRGHPGISGKSPRLSRCLRHYTEAY